jgi:predicted O-methyltransferase YrrM
MKLVWQLRSFLSDKLLQVSYPQLRQAFAIQSHLTARERVALYRIARGVDWVAEVGSYLGASACCFGAALAEREHGRLICVDTWANEAMSEGPRDTWSAFQANTAPFRNRIVPLRGPSAVMAARIREHTSRLDVLFIDGDHSPEGVMADWSSCRALLAPGSIIAFHDYGWAPGVQRTVHEVVLPLVDRHEHLPNLWWGTLARQP